MSDRPTPSSNPAMASGCGCVCSDCLREGLRTHQVCGYGCKLERRSTIPRQDTPSAKDGTPSPTDQIQAAMLCTLHSLDVDDHKAWLEKALREAYEDGYLRACKERMGQPQDALIQALIVGLQAEEKACLEDGDTALAGGIAYAVAFISNQRTEHPKTSAPSESSQGAENPDSLRRSGGSSGEPSGFASQEQGVPCAGPRDPELYMADGKGEPHFHPGFVWNEEAWGPEPKIPRTQEELDTLGPIESIKDCWIEIGRKEEREAIAAWLDTDGGRANCTCLATDIREGVYRTPQPSHSSQKGT